MFKLSKEFPLALDINDFSIEVLQLEKKFGEVSLKRHGRIKLEKGIVLQGEILDQERFLQKLKELLNSLGFESFKNKQIIFSLPESKTFLHLFELPLEISGKELASAIAGQAAKTIPLLIEETYFDFKVLFQKDNMQEVLCVLVKKDIVDSYIKVLKEVGLLPFALDIESASLARVFNKEADLSSALLIIDIGARTSVLTVFDQGFIQISSIVNKAGNYFTEKIAEKLNISFEEAEKRKIEQGFSKTGEDDKILFILLEAIDDVFEEAKNLIAFYKKKKQRDVKKIILCGGSSLLPNITSYFQSNLGFETKVGDPSIAFPKIKKIREESLLEPSREKSFVLFSNVLGLALRGLEKDPETSGINLVPPEQRPSQPKFIKREASRNKNLKILSFFALFFALVFLGFVVYNYVFKVPEKEEVIEENINQEEDLPEQEEVVIEPEIPLALVSVDDTRIIEVSDQTEVVSSLAGFLQSEQQDYVRVLIKDLSLNKFISLKEFFDALQVATPDGFYDLIGEEFMIFSVNQKEGKRLGFIFDLKDKQAFDLLLKTWEKDMESNFVNLFSLIGKTGKALYSSFRNTSYNNVAVRFQTFSKNDLGICYSFLDEYFLFSSSFSGIKDTIDRY